MKILNKQSIIENIYDLEEEIVNAFKIYVGDSKSKNLYKSFSKIKQVKEVIFKVKELKQQLAEDF
jgi:hypothetical protein